MAVNLKNLSSKELQAVIAEAQSRMKEARMNLIQDVRKKIDALLTISGLTLLQRRKPRYQRANGLKFAVEFHPKLSQFARRFLSNFDRPPIRHCSCPDIAPEFRTGSQTIEGTGDDEQERRNGENRSLLLQELFRQGQTDD